MLRNWWLVLIVVMGFVAAAAATAVVRSPTYTAVTRLAVGRIDITSPGALSGYAVATQALANGYSRTVTAQAVAKPVAAKTGLPVAEVQGSVTATPIAESPVFRVEATASTEKLAITLANESSHSLIRYAARLNQNNPDSTRLLDQFKTASVVTKLAKQELHSAVEDAGEEPTTSAEVGVARAQSGYDAAKLRVGALEKAYTASVQGQVATQLVQVISPATTAASDRSSVLLIRVFVGIVIGLLLGGALAYLRESRRVRRVRRAPA